MVAAKSLTISKSERTVSSSPELICKKIVLKNLFLVFFFVSESVDV